MTVDHVTATGLRPRKRMWKMFIVNTDYRGKAGEIAVNEWRG